MDKEVREAAETTISHETEGAHTQKPETVKPMTREPVSGLGMAGWGGVMGAVVDPRAGDREQREG